MADRVVVVTGATAGLGRAIANSFARAGDRVALIARGAEGLEAAAQEVRRNGGSALAIGADVADWDQVERAAKRVEEELGEIDVWVNNAMSTVFAPFHQVTMQEFRRSTEVCYLGFVHGTKAAVDRMLPRDRGVIVQVGSALALRSIPLQSAYCGAKHAIVGFTESIRTELLHERSNVRITMVHMPAMNTPQFDWVRSKLSWRARPVAPIYQPEVAAEAVRYAADHPGRRTYLVGASTVLTVFADKFVPGLLDRYLGRSGYQAQQDEAPEIRGRPDNLFEPVASAPGAHGRFDAESHDRSLQVWLSVHREELSIGALALVSALMSGTALVRSGRRRLL